MKRDIYKELPENFHRVVLSYSSHCKRRGLYGRTVECMGNRGSGFGEVESVAAGAF